MSNQLQMGLSELFREVFEGVAPEASGTWFVQGKEAIFDAVQQLPAADASVRKCGMSASIGAHVRHLCYYLQLFNANLREENPDSDWEGSWAVQEFDEESWQRLREELREEYDFAVDWYRSEPTYVDDEQAIYAIANLAHAAYHLGAIRALLPVAGRS
ncbi:hypothetical protein [Fimbriimonas ginsengisoli]|uniref:DinB-like domain-containing protein n=1 Tax=Fimbriimonas ginsengisoli Gsoil 348 TaxID=661478 RepID=A0A068NV99_FIMGI|nr:hypothetical protein [Fimbriimonas ginsengisoli]AIE87453.1 hypothetical protein OP10G_4085 [Fimbriimonas ginsengisoli Gsoil 348]